MPGRFLYLQNASGPGPVLLKTLKDHQVDIVQQYESERIDWAPYQVVMVSMFSDQVHLCEISDKIRAYLDQGGTLIINGHVARPFLPELCRYEPMEKRGLAELVIHRETAHPAFGDMSTARMYKRRGVAGFYGRGSNPPPDGAQVLHSVGPDHLPVDWIYERPEGGRIFVHSGVELWMFLVGDMGEPPNYLQGFFDWFARTAGNATQEDAT